MEPDWRVHDLFPDGRIAKRACEGLVGSLTMPEALGGQLLTMIVASQVMI